MDINDSGYDLPPTPKRLRRKSKMSRPMILILTGTSVLALLGIGIWSMKKPVAVTVEDESVVAARVAQSRVVAARTVLLEHLLVLNPHPGSVEKAGLIQTAAIQRSNELRVYIDKLRTTKGGAYYNDNFHLVIYKMTLLNNQVLLEALRGKVNQVWLITLEDGSVLRQTPTAAQVIQQCLNSELALRMLTLSQFNQVTENDLNDLLKAQGQLFTALVDSLQQGNNTDAIDQFQRAQNQLAVEQSVPRPTGGGKP